MESKRKSKNKKELERIVSTGMDKDDVNPQTHQFRRAAAAEELLIRSLIKHPDMLESIKGRISPEDMLTELNR